MKKPKARLYLWIAILIVGIEMCVLFAKTASAYRRDSTNADLAAGINRCSPAEVQSALDRGADAVNDMEPRRSIPNIMMDTLLPKRVIKATVFNSSPLSMAVAMKPGASSEIEKWRADRAVIVSKLLRHGANANGHPGYDYSPLYLAICSRDLALTQALLDSGANANGDVVPNVLGLKSPVLSAAACRNLCGDPAIVAALLKHGALVDSCDNSGQTPLMVAAGLGDIDMVTLLLKWHARADLKDRRGFTAAGLVPPSRGPQSQRLGLITLLNLAAKSLSR